MVSDRIQPMKRAFLLCCVLFLFACDARTTESLSDAAKKHRIDVMVEEIRGDLPTVPDWTPERYVVRQDLEKLVLVDVRPLEERGVSQIPGALSIQEWQKRRPELPPDVIVVAYCTIGRRSASWVAYQRASGVNAVNLAGSLLAWVHAGYALEDAQGLPTRRLHVHGRAWDLAPAGFTATW